MKRYFDNLHYEKFADGRVKCIEDEIPFDLPDGWAWSRIKNISLIGTGATPLKSNSTYYKDGTIPWITSAATSKASITLPTDYITNLALAETNCTIYPVGTLIIAMYGEGKTRGQISELDIEACTNQACAALRVLGESKPLRQYVKLYFQYSYGSLRQKAKGGQQPNLNQTIIADTLIPIPPYKEIDRVIMFASDCFDLVDTIEEDKAAVLDGIGCIKKCILDLAIRGQLVPQDPADEPASVLLERIRAEKEELIKQGKIKRDKKESVIFRGEDNSYYVRQDTHTESIDEQFIFELPDNWEWCSLLNIAKIELGKTLDSAKNIGINYPYLRSVNVRWNEVDLSDLKAMRFEPEELDRYTVRQNDLLICEGGDVGRSCVWTDEKEILYQNALHKVRFYGGCNPFYFMYYMMYYESRGIIKALCKGVTIKHLTGNVLSLIPFALPPLEEQNLIVERLNRIFVLLDSIICD